MIFFMAISEEKTEKPTPKKKRDTREKGHVLKSNDVNIAFVLIAMLGAFKIFGPYLIEKIGTVTTYYITGFDYRDSLTTAKANTIFFNSAASIFIAMLPFLATSVLSTLLISYLQVGFLFSKKALTPDFARINPVEGFKRMFSIRALAELLKTILKFCVIAAVVFAEIKKVFHTFAMLIKNDITLSLKYIFETILKISFKLAFALLIIAAFDYLYQWWEYNRNLKMSKQEIKDEFKQVEGDPKIKARIRQKQMQLGLARMMSDVAKADFVLANPTHLAIAIKYDEKENNAPVVVAKGKGYVALKIKEKAMELKIEIIEDKPLAQAMYAAVEIGQEIPQEFYVAIAKILAEIYSVRRR